MACVAIMTVAAAWTGWKSHLHQAGRRRAHTMIYTCALPLYAATDQLPNWAFRDVTYRVGCRRPDLHLAVLFLRDDV